MSSAFSSKSPNPKRLHNASASLPKEYRARESIYVSALVNQEAEMGSLRRGVEKVGKQAGLEKQLRLEENRRSINQTNIFETLQHCKISIASLFNMQKDWSVKHKILAYLNLQLLSKRRLCFVLQRRSTRKRHQREINSGKS